MDRPPWEPATRHRGHTAPYLPGDTTCYGQIHFLPPTFWDVAYPHLLTRSTMVSLGFYIVSMVCESLGFSPLILNHPALTHHSVWWHVNSSASLPPKSSSELISCNPPWHTSWYIPAWSNRNPLCGAMTRFAPFLPRYFVGSLLCPRTEAAENRTGGTGGRLGLKLPLQRADRGDNLRF